MSGEPAYFFGHSPEETRRLRLQAEILGGATRRMLYEAGIGAYMRVLDIGTGAGAVALAAARLVGPSGALSASMPTRSSSRSHASVPRRPGWRRSSSSSTT